MDLIEMAQDRECLRGLVTAVKNFRIPYIAGNFLTIENSLASLQGLCSMQ
jgi:hypothetical protein